MSNTKTSFADMDLDARLQRAIVKLGFNKPTLVQETAIPLALQGKDILAKARTGSGKTAAYCIPVVQKILSQSNPDSIQALILVPTRELAEQVTQHIRDLCMYCSQKVKVVNIAIGDVSLASQVPLLAENPHIVVSTPARISQHLDAGNVDLRTTIESLVIDEADLILSYGYDEDVTKIIQQLPQIFQSYLMSATLSSDVDKLKKLVLRNPAILQLEESEEEDLLTQYYTNCTENEKYLLTLFMLKLRVHPFGSNKSIIFVNSIEKCYKLRLFLEQFGIQSCTLNSELPVKSRYHIVQEFNRGIYDYIIATDESGDLKNVVVDSEDEQDEEPKPVEEVVDGAEEPAETKSKSKKKNRKRRQDGEYGVSRGIDFKNVSAVINFDMPPSSRQYQHRVGRTARGVGNKGYSLTFVTPPPDEPIVHTKKRSKLANENSKPQLPTDEYILSRIHKRQAVAGRVVLPFTFDMEPVERFRYRCTDALRAITPASIKEARIKEIKNEILNSEKLKAHFEDNPADMKALRHDVSIHPAKVQAHMRHVPSYLLPKGKLQVTTGESNEYVPFRIDKKKRSKHKGKSSGSGKRKDPLKSFSYSK
ncbi:P-loop containing nucleoside triphosphate hydrolase protein [Globomyces pollinis-pini]|nr:P-loop containing nucleoside triphosphate hydrolase protein [Globomyces pollinis-pini]